jgi:hypothetical protein
LAQLDETLALDAIATAEDLASTFDAGPEAIRNTLEGLAIYLSSRITAAIEMAGDIWESTR